MIEGPRAVRQEELAELEKLVNRVFRSYEGAPQTMFSEYPDLYSTKNRENMRVIVKDGRPIANINVLPQTLSLYGTDIPMANLGGVCTHPEERGNGCGTLLLKDCMDKMRNEGAVLLHISGDRHMYRSAGSLPSGRIFHYACYAGKKYAPVSRKAEYVPYDDSLLDEVIRLYDAEPVRYRRSRERFLTLLHSNKFIDRIDKERKTFLLKENGVFCTYAMVEISADRTGTVVDCAGDKRLLLDTSFPLMYELGLNAISGILLSNETALKAYAEGQGYEVQTRTLPGTIKILNLPGLIQALRPYFLERLPAATVDAFRCTAEGEIADFELFGKHCLLPQIQKQNDLVFGTAELARKDFLCDNRDFEEFDRFFKAVFPIPFINTGNLSYV